MNLKRSLLCLPLFAMTLSVGPFMRSNTFAAAPEESAFQELLEAYLKEFRPLSIASNQAWWDSSISGKDEDYEKRKVAENALVDLHGKPEVFEKLKAFRAAGTIKDPILARSLEVLFRAYLPNQADAELSKRIVALGADVDQLFNTHRSDVDARRLTENEVRSILKETSDSELARKAWTGYMEVGRKVAPKLKELVQLRNQVAEKLGFRDYFTLQMEIQEFDADELIALFDELDELTKEPFAKLKAEIDTHSLARFRVEADQLRPWHTSDLFFQEAPDLGGVKLDAMFKGKDPVKLSIAHYESMGMEVDGIVKHSDLYEKEGKSPHAFCTSIDREQDIRVLCNVKPNANWMDTMHHELGHGVYDKYIGPTVPFLLREPSHILTTEGMAMLFGSITKTAEFLEKVIQVPADQLERYAVASRKSLTAEKLIFSRWAQVMFRFEKSMYANPDQDLNALWWSLKKRYQLLNPPDDLSGADYGAKVHIVGAPVYYHNYLLGDLFASQVYCYAAKLFLDQENPGDSCFYGNKAVGAYMRDKVFGPGNRLHWQALTQFATGEKLSAKCYAQLYVSK